tara:strand:- start:111 stop:344 length:234 start_codon:yes stop_codon:yes gene_type:complete
MKNDEKLKKIILKVIHENNVGEEFNPQIENETLLIEDLGFDSFNLAQLTVLIEAEFGIDIFENEIPRTFNDIYLIIK